MGLLSFKAGALAGPRASHEPSLSFPPLATSTMDGTGADRAVCEEGRVSSEPPGDPGAGALPEEFSPKPRARSAQGVG